MSSLDRSDFRRVADVTEGGGHATRAAHTALFQVLEGGFLIPDELSVDLTMSNGLKTVNYVAQMH